jgi:hypothetical protein
MSSAAIISVADLDDAALRDHVVSCEQGIRHLQASQAEAMAEMGRRAREADRRGAPDGVVSNHNYEEFLVDEIALLLRCTRIAASHRYQLASAASRYPALIGAWHAGTVDIRKVEVIADQLENARGEYAVSLLESAIEYAAERTAPQLRQWLARRVISVDPPAAEVRRQRAVADRRVVVTPRGDGVSELWALLPSVQARHIQQLVDVVARSADGDDQRTTDQRRADTLVDLVTGHATAPRVDVQVVVPSSTLLGTADAPAWLAGVGPITSGEARELTGRPEPGCTQDSTWRRLLTDPATGTLIDVAENRYRPSAALERAVRLRDVTCRFPGCRRSALGRSTGTDLDHTVPWPSGPTSPTNLVVLCRHHHRLKHSPGWSAKLAPDGKMTWTTPTGRSFITRPWDYG